MIKVYHFKPYTFTYQADLEAHQLRVRKHNGPWIEGPWEAIEVPVTFQSIDGRSFVGQSFTDLLPHVFEIKAEDDHVLEQIGETNG